MQGELIDAGRSQFGWSLWGSAFYCMQLHAYGKMNADLGGADHFTRGTMFHVAAAHHLARAGAEQGGCYVNGVIERDRDRWMGPYDAVEAWVDRKGKGAHLRKMVLDALDLWLRAEPRPRYRVVSVETERCLALGEHDGVWGLYPVGSPAEVEDALQLLGGPDAVTERGVKLVLPHARTRRPVVLTTLNAPGHVRHGRPVLITRRLDVEGVGMDSRTAGKYDIGDHKSTTTNATRDFVGKYQMDGGWGFLRIIGRELYGVAFGDCYAHVVQCRSPWARFTDPVPPAPWRDAQLASDLLDTANRIVAYELSGRDLWRWPKASHETVCTTIYGRCPGHGYCTQGPPRER